MRLKYVAHVALGRNSPFSEWRCAEFVSYCVNPYKALQQTVMVVMIEAAAALAVCGSPNTLLGWYLVNGYISLSLIR